MFIFGYGGTDTSHPANSVYDHINDYYWYIAQHQTDYIYDIDGKAYEGTSGQIMIIPPGHLMHHTARKDAETNWSDDYMYFTSEDMEKIIEQLRLPVNIAFDSSEHKLVDPYIKNLIREKKERKLGYQYRISSLLYDMLVKMARQYEDMINTNSPQKRLLDRVRQEMFKNFKKDWTLKDLAEIAGYSPTYFCTLYNKYYGTTPIDELLKYRVMMAKEELLKKDLSVTEISQKCGFASMHHFSRYFKKYVGVPPSAFGKKR